VSSKLKNQRERRKFRQLFSTSPAGLLPPWLFYHKKGGEKEMIKKSSIEMHMIFLKS
jgi:hypothetical protein